MTTRTVRGVAGTGVVAMAIVLSACSGDDKPDPDPAADALGAALASGDFGDVALGGDASAADVEAQVETIVDGMGETPRTVEVRALVPAEDSEDDDAWDVTLDVSWDLAGDDAADAGNGAGGGSGDEGDAESGDAESGGAEATDDGEPDGAEATDDAEETPAEGDEAGGGEGGDGEGGDAGGADGEGDAGADGRWAYTTTARLSLVEVGEEEQWQAEWSPALLHPDLEAGGRLELNRQDAERGGILGVDGSPIVTARDVFQIGIDKTRFKNGAGNNAMANAARDLADVVDVDGDSLAERVLAAGDKAFVEAITLRSSDAEPVLDDVNNIDGATATPTTMQLAPTREFARPILGSVGEATEEIIEESAGRVEAGDMVGLSGLQLRYEDQLRGTPGLDVQIVPEEGEPTTVFESEPVPGKELATTLSPELQTRGENILADVGPPSAIVAIQPSTGDVLAAASGPGSQGYSTATLGQYAPGSTFKVATSLALLRAGLTPDSALECPATIDVDGRDFKNYDDYPDSALGDIDLRTAVAESCNTAFIGQNGEVSQSELAEAAASLGIGLGNEDALGADGFLGAVPAEAEGTAHAASMIGQGEVLASPLAMATAAASISAGETVVPRLVVGADEDNGGGGEDGAAADGAGEGDDGGAGEGDAGEGDDGGAGEGDAGGGEDGESGDGGQANAAPSSPLKGGEAEQLREMMYAVVDGGSGAFLQSVPGDQVGAKTGTAEYGTESPPSTHAWMIAIQGDLAVAVFVEEGESGSQTAGPLLEEFLSGT